MESGENEKAPGWFFILAETNTLTNPMPYKLISSFLVEGLLLF